MYHSSLSLMLLAASLAARASTTVVTTSNGTVQGGRCPNGQSNYFFSIPYADPPVGELRYQAPQPFSGSYNGTLDGTKTAPICHQFGVANILGGQQSEDCLYLSIYTPANATSTSALPVKVWFYGGSFEIGGSSDPLYDGCFTSTDSIVVTLNYRLGPLGYLALENTTITGNYGVLDQLQSVRWVRDNIAAFGGNPERILIFGQSAGAIGVFALATMPDIKSLVKAAAEFAGYVIGIRTMRTTFTNVKLMTLFSSLVMESGGGFTFPTVSTAQPFHADFASALNCSITDVNCLRSKDPAQLNTTYQQLFVKKDALAFALTLEDWDGAVFPWGPSVGSSLFPIQPSQVGVQVPAVFGSNGKEGSIFVLQTFGMNGISSLTLADYNDFLKINFGAFAPNVSQAYPLSSFDNSVFDAMSIVVRDHCFRCTAYRGASLAEAKGLPVWTYSFNQTPTCPWAEGQSTDSLQLLGAAHTAELAFVFGEVDNLPPPDGNCSLIAREKDISAYMGSAWTDMARNATPGNAWPGFSTASSLGVNFQNGSITPGVVDYSMCDFWGEIDTAMLKAAVMGNSTVPVNGNSTSGGAAPSSAATSLASYGRGTSPISAFMSWSLTTVVLLMLSMI